MTSAERLGTEVERLARALEKLTDAYVDPLFLIDADGVIRGANRALSARGSIPHETFVGSRFDLWAVPDDRCVLIAEFEKALQGETRRFRTEGSSRNDSSRAEITYSPVTVDGEVVAVLGYAFPIAAVEERERHQREADDLLRIAGALASFGAWSVDRATQELRLTPEAGRVLGFEGAKPISLADAIELFEAVNGDEIAAAIEACFEHGTPVDFQSEITRLDGRRTFVRVMGEAIQVAPGDSIRTVHGAIWDVTEAVEAQEREAVLQQRLDVTLDSIEDGLMFLDSSWRITYANTQVERLIRRPLAGVVGRSVWECFPELADSELELAYQRTAREKVRTTVRTYDVPNDAWFDVTAYPTATGIALYIRDVSSDELTRQSMHEAQRRVTEQAALIDAARDAIIVRTLDEVILYWNPAAEALYGYKAEEVLGKRVRDVISIDVDDFERCTALALTDGHWSEERPVVTHDGRSLIIDIRWQVLYDPEGKPDRIFSVDTDVTEWRKQENLRARATRMESLGTFAGGIAHDLNNVLTPVLMSIQLLENGETDSSRLELLRTMEAAAKRGADMIQQVLSFARGVDGRRERISIDELLEEVRRFATDSLPADIAFSVELDDDVPDTMGDSTQLIQVLTNLVANARDAMPEGGSLEVSASTLLLEDDFSAELFRLDPGRYVVVDVVDTGHGMTPEVQEKIFEPFYTTKSVGKGTGLGLASSLTIVRSHGGTIRVYSEPGEGTRFSVVLPVVVGEPRGPRSGVLPTRQLPHGDGELILIVDDDETITLIASRTLENYGYRTVTAENGRVAIGLIERDDTDVALVLTDMMMPVMDGAATTAYLEEHHPEIPVVAASGLTSAGGASRSAGMGIAAFLPKPYTTSLLLTTLREVLDASARRGHHGEQTLTNDG